MTRFSPCSWLNNIIFHHIRIYHILIHSSIDGHAGFSMLWLLWIILPWKWERRSFRDPIFISFGNILRRRTDGSDGSSIFNFLIRISTVAVPIYILTNSAQAFVGAVLKSQEQTWHHSSHRLEQHIAAREAVGWWTKKCHRNQRSKVPYVLPAEGTSTR